MFDSEFEKEIDKIPSVKHDTDFSEDIKSNIKDVMNETHCTVMNHVVIV